jgi:hypothetical protein
MINGKACVIVGLFWSLDYKAALKGDRSIRGGHYSDTAEHKSKQNNSCTIMVLFILFSIKVVHKLFAGKLLAEADSDLAMTNCGFQRGSLARLVLIAIGTTIAIQFAEKNKW